MAFFKFRKGGDEHPTPAPAAESVEVLRKRARHRLIGSAILVLIGVVGFPLLFDNQPRPIAVDIPIEIPDKAKVKPLAGAPVAAPASTPAVAPVAVQTSPTPVTAAVAPTLPAPVASKPVAKVEPKPEPKSDPKPVEKPQDAATAQALLDGKEAAKKPDAAASAPSGRFIVQVGAFADVVKAREARHKLEKAGLKTYTQVVQTAEGKRIRVRVGPFESKAEVDKVAAKIKKLDLPAAVLEL
jgi:DedD protein